MSFQVNGTIFIACRAPKSFDTGLNGHMASDLLVWLHKIVANVHPIQLTCAVYKPRPSTPPSLDTHDSLNELQYTFYSRDGAAVLIYFTSDTLQRPIHYPAIHDERFMVNLLASATPINRETLT